MHAYIYNKTLYLKLCIQSSMVWKLRCRARISASGKMLCWLAP